jgi:hypothetical protein
VESKFDAPEKKVMTCMPLKMVDDEEPRDTMMNEGNVTQSYIENEGGIALDRMSPGKRGRLGKDEEIKGFDMASLDSLQIDDANESICEMKKETAIPILKNNEKILQSRNNNIPPFSKRVKTTDPDKLAHSMIWELNKVAG